MASFLGVLVLSGILYLYKNQNKQMLIRNGKAEMLMNGQFTLNEIQYTMGRLGLGLPSNYDYLTYSSGDLVVRANSSKLSSAGTMDAGSNSSRTIYSIPIADTILFVDKSWAVVRLTSGNTEVTIEKVAPKSGFPLFALITLTGDKALFPNAATIYPEERIRIHRCTGIGADTLKNNFKLIYENAGKRAGINTLALTLAEQVDSIGFKFYLTSGDSLDILPVPQTLFNQVGVTVRVKSDLRDRARSGDGYARDTLTAKVNYRRYL